MTTSPDTPQEVIVIQESIRKIEKSARVVDDIHPELVKLIKSKIVAEHLLEIEHNFVQKLVTQGVVTQKEAETLFHSIEADERLISKARKAQALEIARAQALVLQVSRTAGVSPRACDIEAASSEARSRFKQSPSTEMLLVAQNTASGTKSNIRRGLRKRHSETNMDKSVGMAIDALQADADASSNLSWGTCARDARGSISVDRPVRVDDAFLSGEVAVLVSDGDTPNLLTCASWGESRRRHARRLRARRDWRRAGGPSQRSAVVEDRTPRNKWRARMPPLRP